MVVLARGGLSLFLLNFRKMLNHRNTVLGITAALALLVAWQVGSLVWKLWLLGDESPRAETLAPVSLKSAEPESLQNLLRYPLIRSATMPGLEGPASIDAPETTLNLKLVGVMYSTDEKEARAIIESPAEGARSFALRERVADNAEIYSIEPDRVILLHAGRQEALMLDPDQNAAGNPAGAAAQPLNDQGGNQAAINTANGSPASADSQTASFQPPAGASKKLDDLMRDFSVTPVMENGILQGFKLKALRNPKIMQEWGIGPDDVVTAVNGIPLNTPGRVMILYDKLKKQREFEITLDNNGSSRTVAVDLTE
jgi:general secretion pathway protein C